MTVVRDGILLALAILMTVFAFQEARKPHPWTTPKSKPTEVSASWRFCLQ